MSAVDSQVRPALEHWLNTNISVAESIVARIILAARAREAEPRRATGSGAGKRRPPAASRCRASSATAPRPAATTASCSSSKAIRPAARPSRGATARRQAILPLRGKVLNTESVSLAKVLENKELTDLGDRARVRARARTSISPASATDASSSLPTPTPTATTSRRCSSRSCTATCPGSSARAACSSPSLPSTASTSARRRSGRSTTRTRSDC